MELKDLVLKTSSLSYARSMQPSSGLFRAWNSQSPEETRFVKVVFREGLGQKAHHTNNTGDALTAEVGGSAMMNPVGGDTCEVPVGCDRIGVSFTLRCLPNSLEPQSTNSSLVAKSLREVAQRYSDAGGFRYLAALYLENLANARFVYRNLMMADEARVTITFEDEQISFDPFAFALDEPAQDINFDEQLAVLAAGLVEGDRDQVEELIDLMAEGLMEGRAPAINVNYEAHVCELEEVFPSQEYTEGKVLASTSAMENGKMIRAAIMTPQKLGSAIRTIDRWHLDGEYSSQPINPYGGVKSDKKALRINGSAPSLYEILKKPEDHLASLFEAGEPSAAAHFLMGNLIRGGVFGISDELSAKQKKKLEEDKASKAQSELEKQAA
jgi:CRISPR-associated protein Csy3